jgi:DNA-binding GntR family transcriptional regulator
MTKRVFTIKYLLEIPKSDENSNVGDFVYRTIRENIINWNIKPGVMISEKELSEQFRASRTPVREAFIKLGREGLVEILPQRGTVISKIDLGRVEEERFIRESLEVAVLNVAVERFPPERLPAFEENLKQQQECVENIDYKRFLKVDDEFHRIMFLGCNKELSWEVIQNISGHYKRIRAMTLWDRQVLEDLIRQHTAIFEAIRDKDLEKANSNLKKHLRKLIVEEKEMKAKYPEYFL